MAAHSPVFLAQKLNALVDAERFFGHWKERFREPQTYGSLIKSYCPFHVGEGFRSFLLDLKKKTFRCTMTQCKASFTGTLPELHALLVDKPLLDGLLDLIGVFKIDVPGEMHAHLAGALDAHARQLMEQGKMDAAENAAALAMREDPTNPTIRLRLAEICEKRQRPRDAVPHYDSAVGDAIERQDWHRAESILQRLKEIAPDQEDYLEQEARVAEARGDRRAAMQNYLRLAEQSADQPEKRMNWLEKARGFDPASSQVRRQLAEVAEEAGDREKAENLWRAILERASAQADRDNALRALDSLIHLHPDDPRLPERKAEILLSENRAEEAVDLLRQVAGSALESGDLKRAERVLRRLCEAAPEDPVCQWQLFTLLEQSDQTEEAALVGDRILAQADETGDNRTVEILQRLKKWKPNNLNYREQLADYYDRTDQAPEAFAERLELAEICFDKGLSGEALAHIRATLDRSDVERPRRMEIAALLADRDCPAQAVAEYENVARQAFENDDLDQAEEACRKGLEVVRDYPPLHEVLLQVSLERRPDQALEQCERLVELYRAQGKADQAVRILEQVKQRLADRPEPGILLARLSAEIDRPDTAIAELKQVAGRKISSQQMDEALRIADAVAQRHEDRLDLLQILIDLHRSRGSTDQVVDAMLRMAAAQKAAGANDAAEATYLEIFAFRPDEGRALYGHAELVRLERGFVAAKPLYQRYIQQLLTAGRGEEAVKTYLRCIDWAPEDVDLRRALGALLAEHGDPEGARNQWEAAALTYLTVHDNPAAAAECYESILSHSPGDIETRRNLAHLYVRLEKDDAARQAFHQIAETLGDLADHESQIETYREALKLFPNDGFLTRQLALCLQAAGRGGEAVEVLDQLLENSNEAVDSGEVVATLRNLVEMEPERIPLRRRLADLLAESGDKDAVRHFQILAHNYQERGELDEAVRARLWLKDRQPADVKNRRALIGILRKLKDLDALKRELDELATVHRHQNQRADALAVMEERRELDPEDIDHDIALAGLREELGQTKEAAEEYCRLGEILQQRRNPDRARELLERALQLRPGDAKFRRRLVKLSLKAEDKSRAVTELLSLAEAFFNTGENDEAADCLRQLLKIGRKDADIHLRVARVFARHDCGEQARDVYNRAILRCERSKDDAKLLEVLESAVADFPDDPEFLQKKLEMESLLNNAEAVAASAHRLAGLLRERKAEPDQIDAAYRRALESAEPSPDLLNEIAEFHLENNRPGEAASILRRLVKLRESKGDLDGAIEALNRIVSFRPSDEPSLRDLARLNEEVGDYESSREVVLRLGGHLISHGQWREAREVYESVVEQEGMEEKVLPHLIRITQELGDLEAENLYSARWTEYLENQGRADEAIRACEKAIERTPDNLEALRKLAELCGRRGEGERQVATLEQLASICETAGQWDQAAAARLQIRTLVPDRIENLSSLAEIYQRSERARDAAEIWSEVFQVALDARERSRAATIARRILELDPARNDVRRRLADLLVKLEAPAEAAEEFSRLGARLAESNPKDAIAAYRQGLQHHPARPRDHEALASLLAREGDTDAAAAEYLQAAQGFAASGEFTHGTACLQALLALNPNHRQARELLVQMQLDGGESVQAVGEAVALADRALQENRREDAERILQKAAEAGPERAALACERLIGLYMADSRAEDALRQLGPLVEKARRDANTAKLIGYLESVCELVPIDHEHRIELVELHLQEGQRRKALEHFRKLLPTLTKMKMLGEGDRVGQLLLAESETDWEIKEEVARAYVQAEMTDLAIMTYLDLASSARGERDYERMTDFASSALGLDTDNLAAREMLFEANLQLGQRREAFLHAGALTRLYDDQDQPEKAIAIARRMTELMPDEPAGFERLTQLLEKQGAENELCDVLEPLAQLYIRLGDKMKAVDTLARYLVVRPDNVEIRKQYVVLYAEVGDEEELIDDYLTLIDSAWESEDVEETDRLFQLALKSDPGNVDLLEKRVGFLFDQNRVEEANNTLLTLADRLCENRKYKKATELLAAAAVRSPESGALSARLGELYITQNAKGRAIEQFKKAAQQFLNTKRRQAAHNVIERILEIDPLDVGTRSALIDSLLAAGDADLALQHARILADHYFERELFDLAEQEYRRIISHNPQDMSAWNNIIEIAERMGSQPDYLGDYLLMADLQAEAGRLEEAARTYRKVIEIDPENIDARKASIDIHLQTGMESEVVPEYIELADLLAARGRVDEAVGYYERVLMIEKDNTHATRQVRRLQPDLSNDQTVRLSGKTRSIRSKTAGDTAGDQTRGRRMDETAVRDALDNYRQILQTKPDNPMVRSRVAELLHQLGRISDAIQEWEQASEIFLERGEFDPAIRLYERILEADPTRTDIRDRLSRVSLKKDSMAAIESAIESLEGEEFGFEGEPKAEK